MFCYKNYTWVINNVLCYNQCLMKEMDFKYLYVYNPLQLYFPFKQLYF